jgi:hypothetical protein
MQHTVRSRYRPYGSKHLSLDQATNIIEAVEYARTIELPLLAHATIHWSGTVVFDDPDGKLFAKVREGLHKWLPRRSIAGGLTSVWCRECKAYTDVVHCHLLFHLPVEYRTGARFLEVEAALFRLVGRHGGGILGEFAVKLVIHPDPDGLYLLKGGESTDLGSFQDQEGVAQIARHRPRQALRPHGEHWKGCTQPLEPSAANR